MRAREVLERHRSELLGLPGVVGVGIGEGGVIELLVEEEPGPYPREVEGVPVRVRAVGRLRAEDGGREGAP